MAYKIDEIEGIGPSYAEKLMHASISTTDELLDLCCSKSGRTSVASKTGITESQLLKWSNMADLMRVSGVGKQYAELLEAAGVESIKELRQRNAENLAGAMNTLNDEKHLTKGTAHAETVQGWIDAAKAIEPRITH